MASWDSNRVKVRLFTIQMLLGTEGRNLSVPAQADRAALGAAAI